MRSAHQSLSVSPSPRRRRVAVLRRGLGAVRVEGDPALIALFARKGGVGVSVTSVLLGSVAAAHPRGVLLVDLRGHLEAAVGLAHEDGPGLTDWLAADQTPTGDALKRLERSVSSGLTLLPYGDANLAEARHTAALLDHLEQDPRVVIIDCGQLPRGSSPAATQTAESVAAAVAARCRTRWLVTRACYLAVQASVSRAVEPSGCILLTESHRALRAPDVADALGLPIVLDLAMDPTVARLVDAGLLVSRVPRDLERVLHQVLDGAE